MAFIIESATGKLASGHLGGHCCFIAQRQENAATVGKLKAAPRTLRYLHAGVCCVGVQEGAGQGGREAGELRQG